MKNTFAVLSVPTFDRESFIHSALPATTSFHFNIFLSNLKQRTVEHDHRSCIAFSSLERTKNGNYF